MKTTRLLRAFGLLIAPFLSACGGQPSPALSPHISAPAVVAAPSSAVEAEAACECDQKKLTTPGNPTADPEKYWRTPWLEPAVRGTKVLPDLHATDQDGRPIKSSDLRGRPFALTFLYTRCTNPNRCPLIATQTGRLQSLLEAEGLDSRVRLAIMTYDPIYDTPERLKQYGLDHGIRFTPNVSLLRPDPQGRDRFFDKLQVAVNYDGAQVNLHGIQLFLFDSRARFVRRYQSVIWDGAEVVFDLKQLVQETL